MKRCSSGGGDLRLSSEPGASESARDRIGELIDRWNMDVTGDHDYRPVVIFLRDADDRVRGGITGGVWGGWFHVVALWVDVPLRGRGAGRELLLAAEREARGHGATHAFLETHSFQAPRFYERLGYRVFGVLEDYPPGERQYFMRKDLA
jgi:ribosomal protein S18 acetylase RimI-like enzyme